MPIFGVAKILGYELDTVGAVIFALFAKTSFGGHLLGALGDALIVSAPDWMETQENLS